MTAYPNPGADAPDPATTDASDSRRDAGRGYSPEAVAAWEAMFRATTTIARDLADGEAWGDLSQHEYGVLYALSKEPSGVRICSLNEDVLLTQTGLSRLVTRLADRGLVARSADPTDGRSTLLTLTDEGKKAQRAIGRIHAREITAAMARALDLDQLCELQDLCARLLKDAR